MIYQSGYLTIKDYNREFGTFLLDYPNNEVWWLLTPRRQVRRKSGKSAECGDICIEDKKLFTPYNNNLQSIQYYEDKRNKDQ